MMALLEAVFKRATQDRATLPFSVISKEAQVPIDEVEHVIMKALASARSRLSRWEDDADDDFCMAVRACVCACPQTEPDPRDDRPTGVGREYLVGATDSRLESHSRELGFTDCGNTPPTIPEISSQRKPPA